MTDKKNGESNNLPALHHVCHHTFIGGVFPSLISPVLVIFWRLSLYEAAKLPFIPIQNKHDLYHTINIINVITSKN